MVVTLVFTLWWLSVLWIKTPRKYLELIAEPSSSCTEDNEDDEDEDAGSHDASHDPLLLSPDPAAAAAPTRRKPQQHQQNGNRFSRWISPTAVWSPAATTNKQANSTTITTGDETVTTTSPLRISQSVLEKFGNTIGDKRFFYAEF